MTAHLNSGSNHYFVREKVTSVTPRSCSLWSVPVARGAINFPFGFVSECSSLLVGTIHRFTTAALDVATEDNWWRRRLALWQSDDLTLAAYVTLAYRF